MFKWFWTIFSLGAPEFISSLRLFEIKMMIKKKFLLDLYWNVN